MSTRLSDRQAEGVAELQEAGRLVAASLVIAPAMWRVSLAITPSGRPSIRGQGGDHLRREALAQEGDRALVGERLDDRLHRVGAALALGDGVAERRLVGLGPGRRRRPGSRRAAASSRGRLGLVGDDEVDHAVAGLHLDRADLVGVDLAEAAALDHRRPAHAERDVLGGDDQVRAAGDHGVAGEAAAGDDGDPRHQAREPRPEREGAGVERGDDRVVGVARPPAAALGEEDGRQAHALDQLEEPVLLAVAEGALGAGEHGVVVGEHGAGGALAEEVAVDARRAADQAVGGGARDQVLELAPAALGGDREAAVLDEGAGVDQVGEVLAGGAPAGRVAALDRLLARRVLGQRPALQQLGQILALSFAASLPVWHGRHVPRRLLKYRHQSLLLECCPFAR